jgi:hypothetical protein
MIAAFYSGKVKMAAFIGLSAQRRAGGGRVTVSGLRALPAQATGDFT